MNTTAERPRISLLATGGTIAGKDRAGHGYVSAAMPAEELLATVPELAVLARLEAEQVLSIGSQDMDGESWRKLARRAQQKLDEPGVAGLVITHGTDTMEETAYFLNLVLRTAKPVVLVGAMRPATALSADGPMNLYNAVAVAADARAGGRGVLVVANDEVHFAREVTKTNTTQVGTFKSSNRGLAGTVNHGRLHFYGPPERPHTAASGFAPLAADDFPRVDIIAGYAGQTREAVDAAVRAGARGLVLAGVGAGNLPKAVLAACAGAARAGVAVVRGSRTGGGVVERNIEVDDDALGLIAAGELNPAKARVLLMLGLMRTTDAAALQALFDRY